MAQHATVSRTFNCQLVSAARLHKLGLVLLDNESNTLPTPPTSTETTLASIYELTSSSKNYWSPGYGILQRFVLVKFPGNTGQGSKEGYIPRGSVTQRKRVVSLRELDSRRT